MKKRLDWIPSDSNYEAVKPDLGFTTKHDTFPREPILETKPFSGDNGGFTRITTTSRVLMASVAALKAAGMPKDVEEGKCELACQKGKLKVWTV